MSTQSSRNAATLANVSDETSVPEKPDRSVHNKVKLKYKRLQMKFQDIVSDQKTLQQELVSASAKQSKIQAECDLLLDQIMQSREVDRSLPPENDPAEIWESSEDDEQGERFSAFGRKASTRKSPGGGPPTSVAGRKRPRGDSASELASEAHSPKRNRTTVSQEPFT